MRVTWKILIFYEGDGDFYEALTTIKDELRLVNTPNLYLPSLPSNFLLYRKDIVVVGFQDNTLSLDLQQLGRVIWMNNLADRIRDEPISIYWFSH